MKKLLFLSLALTAASGIATAATVSCTVVSPAPPAGVTGVQTATGDINGNTNNTGASFSLTGGATCGAARRYVGKLLAVVGFLFGGGENVRDAAVAAGWGPVDVTLHRCPPIYAGYPRRMM